MVIYFHISASVGTPSVVHPIQRRITYLAFIHSELSSCSSSAVLPPSERGIMLIIAPTELTEESGFSLASSNSLKTKRLQESSA